MKLATLPPSVLRLILDHNFSWAAIQLWLTGDRSMRLSLANGGIRHMQLDHQSTYAPVTWPRCLKEFQLLSLSVKCCVRPAPVPQLRAELLRVYPRLEKLELCFPAAIDLFTDNLTLVAVSASNASNTLTTRDLGPVDGVSSKNGPEGNEESDSDEPIAKRPKLASTASTASLSDTWNPHRAFPHLTSLSLTGQDSLAERKEVNLSKLPDSLKSLRLSRIGWLRCIDWAPLESLTLVSSPGIVVPNLVRSAPKTLTQLNCSPEHLTTLFKELSSRFPLLRSTNHVQNLHSRNSITCPPSYVQQVALTGSPSELSFRLPNDITRLQVTEIAQPTFTDWPLNLVALTVHKGFSPRQFHLLPRTLTELDSREGSSDFADLSTIGVTTINVRDAVAWSHCKAELLTYGKTRGGVDMPFVEAYIDRVESGGLFGLPVGLKTLVCHDSEWIGHNELCLPPKLCSIYTNFALDLHDNLHLFRLFPPSVTHASLSVGFQTKPDSELTSSMHHFTNLPYLRSAEIKSEKAADLPHWLPLLPKCVLALTLTIPTGYPKAEALLELPPNLTSLLLDTNAVAPSDNWLHTLPRSLKTIGRSPLVTASDLVNLPPSLVSLSATVRNLTINDLLSLPRSLREFTAYASKSKKPADKPGLVMMPGWNKLVSNCRPFWRILDLDREEIMRILRTAK